MGQTIGGDGPVQWVATPPACGVLPIRLDNFQFWSMAVACASPSLAVAEPRSYAWFAQVTHRIGAAARA